MLDCHQVFENDFSFATYCGDTCYTVVKRENGKLKEVLETKLLEIEPPEGEIGLFIFKAAPVFDLLGSNNNKSYSNDKDEHGFLYVIKDLLLLGFKVEGYPVAREQDILSFNSPADLNDILKFFQKSKV